MQHDYSTLIGLIVITAFILGMRALSRRMFASDTGVPAGDAKPLVLVRTYRGSAESAAKTFHAQAVEMAKQGYFPISQSYTPGAYTCGEFLFALLLFVIVIGVIIFIYMLLVKPPGTLQVTYELREPRTAAAPPAQVTVPPVLGSEKVCPRCAETVKGAAKVCRFCGHEFPAGPAKP